jgi:hypothetical protein
MVATTMTLDGYNACLQLWQAAARSSSMRGVVIGEVMGFCGSDFCALQSLETLSILRYVSILSIDSFACTNVLPKQVHTTVQDQDHNMTLRRHSGLPAPQHRREIDEL